MATSLGSSNLKEDVTKPLRSDPWATGQALQRGSSDIDPNKKLTLPRGFALIPADPDVRFSQLRLISKVFYPLGNLSPR